MYIITIILLTILIPIVQLARPTLKLTFDPDKRFIYPPEQVDIQCELINPISRDDIAQLWYVDLKTGKRTPISRELITSPTDDAPEVFKLNRNQRYVYPKKNSLRIRSSKMEDSARYECDCPDCGEVVPKQTRELHVMKLVEPHWIIDSGWPLHENTRVTIKCQVDDFYPYLGHKILRDHHEITNDGKSTLSNSNPFPQTFIWEAIITPTAEWHNSTLRCTVTEGSVERHTTKSLDVLFDARLLKCENRQYIDSNAEKSTIECSYSGNPQPKLTWFRQSDQKPITSDIGITLDIKEENHGKYKSIVTFDRNKLITIPLPPIINGQQNRTGENYYQQLLNNGFFVRLTVNGKEKTTQNIEIVRDANKIPSKLLNNSIKQRFSSILFTFLLILHLIQR